MEAGLIALVVFLIVDIIILIYIKRKKSELGDVSWYRTSVNPGLGKKGKINRLKGLCN